MGLGTAYAEPIKGFRGEIDGFLGMRGAPFYWNPKTEALVAILERSHRGECNRDNNHDARPIFVLS